MSFDYELSHHQFNLHQVSDAEQPSAIKIEEHFYSIVPKNAEQFGVIKELLERAIREHKITTLADLKQHITHRPTSAAATASAQISRKGFEIIHFQQLKAQTVNKIAQELVRQYVFPEKGQEAGQFIQRKLEKGGYDKIFDSEEFVRVLTQDLRSITKDLHLCVELKLPSTTASQPTISANRVDLTEFPGLPHLENIKAYIAPTNVGHMGEPMRAWPFEFKSGFLDKKETIGYFDLRKFGICEPNSEYAKNVFQKWFPGIGDSVRIEDARARCQAIREMIQHLRDAKTIVIDLRWCSGGDPYAVRYLCSFFMKPDVLLNRLDWRTSEGIKSEYFYTLPESDLPSSERLLTTPLFIITGPDTFSAAEEFTKDMKVYNNKAQVVGEKTAGGANPGGWHDLNDHFEMFIPTGRAAMDNWEGVGIIPHHIVPHKDALEAILKLISK